MAVVRVLKVFEDGLHQFKVDSSCPSFGGLRHVQRSLNRGMKMRHSATNLLSNLISGDVICLLSNLKKLVFMLVDTFCRTSDMPRHVCNGKPLYGDQVHVMLD